jgi:hypothetical protein
VRRARAMARITETATHFSQESRSVSLYSKQIQVGRGHLGPLGSVLTTITEQATLYRRAYRGGEIQFTATQGATGVSGMKPPSAISGSVASNVLKIASVLFQ